MVLIALNQIAQMIVIHMEYVRIQHVIAMKASLENNVNTKLVRMNVATKANACKMELANVIKVIQELIALPHTVVMIVMEMENVLAISVSVLINGLVSIA
jgi:hypothetical protein